MTDQEREQLHGLLWARVQQEVKAGSLDDASRALTMMEGQRAVQRMREREHDN